MADQYRAANHANWEERAQIHATDQTGMYRIGDVLAGRSCLHAVEARDLGDVKGLRIAHLQCHIGLDTLSLAHLGAHPVGLDFSEKAIEAARDFAARCGRSDVRFVVSDVYAARAALEGDFDLVYVTWGAINWLPDIGAWANVVASLLKPRGKLYLAETHPAALCLEEREGKIELAYDWQTPVDRPLLFADVTTYTGDPRLLQNTETYEWIHPLSSIIAALHHAGLTLEFLREHDRLPYKLFPSMLPAQGEELKGLFHLPSHLPRFPLSFSLSAVKIA